MTSKTEQLRAENSILKTRLKAATDLLSARQNRSKGKHIALKNQLLLTTEEIHKTVVAIEKDDEERQKKKRKRNLKKQAHQAEIDSDDVEGSDSDDLILPEGILDCIVVAECE